MSFQCKVGHLQLQAVKLLQSNFQEKAHVAWGFHLGSGSQILLPWPVRFCFLSLDFWVCYLKKTNKKTPKPLFLGLCVQAFPQLPKSDIFFFSFHLIFFIFYILNLLFSTHPDADLEVLLSANDFFLNLADFLY